MAKATKKTTREYTPEPAKTEAEVLNMGPAFKQTGDADRDLEGMMNSMTDDAPGPRQREEQGEGDAIEDGLEEVDIGGTKLRVGSDIARVIRAQADAHGRQLAELRRSLPLAQPAGKPEPEPDPLEGIDTALFTDPKKAVGRILEIADKRIGDRLTGAYRAEQQTAEYFRQFYVDNKDLEGLDDIVRSVLRSNLQELASLDPPQSRQRLATLAKQHINTIVNRFGGSASDGNPAPRRTTVEAPNQAVVEKPKRAETREEAPPSLSSMLKARRRARQQQLRTATS